MQYVRFSKPNKGKDSLFHASRSRLLHSDVLSYGDREVEVEFSSWGYFVLLLSYAYPFAAVGPTRSVLTPSLSLAEYQNDQQVEIVSFHKRRSSKKQTDAKFTTPAAKMQLKQSVSDLTSLEGKKVLIRYVPMVLSCAFVFDSTAAAAVTVECFYFFSPTRRKKPRVIFIDFCRTHKHAFVNKMGLSPYETERRQRLAFFNFFNLNTFIGTQNCQHNKNTASILTYHWKMVSLRMIIGSVRRCQPWRRFWIKVHLQSWWVI